MTERQKWDLREKRKRSWRKKHFGPDFLVHFPGCDPGEQPIFPVGKIGVAPDISGKLIFVPL